MSVPQKICEIRCGAKVEMNPNEDSLFMALRMDYCYV